MKVIGVENMVYGESKAIRCTKWEFVLPLFAALYPQSQQTIENHLNSR